MEKTLYSETKGKPFYSNMTKYFVSFGPRIVKHSLKIYSKHKSNYNRNQQILDIFYTASFAIFRNYSNQ